MQPKTGYYARIMLGGFNDLFCSKLCRHKIRMPNPVSYWNSSFHKPMYVSINLSIYWTLLI